MAKTEETSAPTEATADKPAEKPVLSGAEGEEVQEEVAETEKASAPAEATAEKPTKKEEVKEKAAESKAEPAEGETAEIKDEAKAEMKVKMLNGQLFISTSAVELPIFSSGDTITVHYKIREGNKERIQQFQGVVIQRRGSHTTETCTVRKVSGGIGVERIFPLHSPFIDKIIVNKRGKVRRARIFYLRKLKGKKARIEEKRQFNKQ